MDLLATLHQSEGLPLEEAAPPGWTVSHGVRAFVLCAFLGVGCAFIATIWSPRIGIIACCYGILALGLVIGRFWIEHRLPPSGLEKQIAVGGGLVTLAVFCVSTAGLPAIQSFRHGLFSSGIAIGSYKAALLAVALVAVAYLGRLGVRMRLLYPFCEACSSWRRCITSYGHFAGSEEQLKERLFARDFRYLTNVHDTGSNIYRFTLTSCRCNAAQLLDVDYDFDPGEPTPMREVVRQLQLTRAEAETIRAYLPDSSRLWYELNGWIATFTLVMLSTQVVYFLLRTVGL